MGGAFNVGANVFATEKVVYNEYNPFVFPIIKMLLEQDKRKLIQSIEDTIRENMLENTKKEEYLEFRKKYNYIQKTPLNLFVLHMFAFQNLIRFNSKFEFNTPVGNAGYNEGLKQRIMEFRAKAPILELQQGSFADLDINKFEKGSVFYFDPPYLITTAEYNDGKRGLKGWDSDIEAELLSFLRRIDKNGQYFMLSNVIEHQGKVNHMLKEWVDTHGYTVVEIGKTGSRYPRTEVLVKNF
jgi:adenine-specific DNA-methyltransferase